MTEEACTVAAHTPTPEEMEQELRTLRQRVADLENIEEHLRASEERFRVLIESSAIATWIHHQGRIVYANPATEALLGYTYEELAAMQVWDIIHPDSRDMVRQRAAARHDGQDVVSRYEVQIITRTASERWVELHAHRIEFEQMPCILVSFIDVHERKQMEEAIRVNETRFRVLTETITAGILIHRQGKFLYVNPAGAAITGYSREEIQQMTFQDIIHPDFLELVRQRAQARHSGADASSRYEIKIMTRSGQECWVELSAGLIEFEDAPAIVVTVNDVTERKQVEVERSQFQASIIEAQSATLRELSTPLIPLTNDVVVMPLIGHIDSQRAGQIVDTLLHGIATHHARIAIIDITGVPVVDSQVALVLIQAARATRLLGAQVILTGIRPDIANSLVALDIQLSDIITRSTLQAGVAYALAHYSNNIPHQTT